MKASRKTSRCNSPLVRKGGITPKNPKHTPQNKTKTNLSIRLQIDEPKTIAHAHTKLYLTPLQLLSYLNPPR